MVTYEYFTDLVTKVLNHHRFEKTKRILEKTNPYFTFNL